MNWSDLIKTYINNYYAITDRLFDMVEDDKLDWKPSQENNWMTTGQLVCHITDGCGKAMNGFVTGDWGLPEGMSFEDMDPENMLPPAEAMPTVDSIAEAKKMLAEDKQLALDIVERTPEEELENKIISAPWDPGKENRLGFFLLEMTQHLRSHAYQLFYYLKLQGKPVSTHHLW